MNSLLKKAASAYLNNTYIRTIIRLLPKGGALDFFLSEKASEINLHKTQLTIDKINNAKAVIKTINDSEEIGSILKIRGGPTLQSPKLNCLGSFPLSSKQRKTSEKIKLDLQKKKHPNDPCAVLINQPNWEDDPLYLNFHTLYYSDLCALRQENITSIIISANVVIYSEEENCLLLHRRSQESDNYPDTLHTFGGAYMPPEVGDRGDIKGLKECVVREVHEETGLSINIPENTPVIIIDEYAINFLQVTYLGINVSINQLKELRPNWEGTITKVTFDDLQNRLMNIQAWTKTGMVDILFWLALGIPNSKKPIRFAGKSSEELCKSIIRQLTIRQNN